MNNPAKQSVLKRIGQNIRSLRMQRHIELKKMSAELHITRQALSKIETGKSDISVSRILEFSQYLHVDYSEILSAVSSTVYNFHSSQNSGGYHVQHAVNNTFNTEWTESLKAFIREEIRKAK